MRNLFLCLVVLLISGCAFNKPNPIILIDTEQHYLIPANTEFKARLEKDGPLVAVVRPHDTWAVDASHLIKLEEQANACTTK